MKPASDLDPGHDGRRYFLFVHQNGVASSQSDRVFGPLAIRANSRIAAPALSRNRADWP
jgi:hypothetical protein